MENGKHAQIQIDVCTSEVIRCSIDALALSLRKQSVGCQTDGAGDGVRRGLKLEVLASAYHVLHVVVRMSAIFGHLELRDVGNTPGLQRDLETLACVSIVGKHC